MNKKMLSACAMVLFIMILSGCSTPFKMIAKFNNCLHEKEYLVTGRVLDKDSTPIENCKIVLIKRKFEAFYPESAARKGELLNEIPAVTDKLGQYTISFELLGANDVRIYFDAEDKGFNIRYVELNDMMGHTILQTNGNNPIIANVVLEKNVE
jgi:hypothetical protein